MSVVYTSVSNIIHSRIDRSFDITDVYDNNILTCSLILTSLQSVPHDTSVNLIDLHFNLFILIIYKHV